MSNALDISNTSMVIDATDYYRLSACDAGREHKIQWRKSTAHKWIEYGRYQQFKEAALAWHILTGKKLERPV